MHIKKQMVSYKHPCGESAEQHIRIMPHWARLIKGVKDGYLEWEDLPVTQETKVPVNSWIIECSGCMERNLRLLKIHETGYTTVLVQGTLEHIDAFLEEVKMKLEKEDSTLPKEMKLETGEYTLLYKINDEEAVKYLKG